MRGTLSKMRAVVKDPLDYFLPLGDVSVPLQPWLGKVITLRYSGEIYCASCGKKTNKSYNQGHCFVCFRKLASCDMCIMKPEQCHYEQGTCREPQWGEDNCMIPHYVYLANSSGIKVGITRHTQVPTRWIDQGASEAVPVFKVQTRYQSGLLEVMLGEHIADKTNWQVMLKGEPDAVDLLSERDRLLQECGPQLEGLMQQFPQAIEVLQEQPQKFSYPVLEYPKKVKAISFDTAPEIKGTLMGIKGQYLILDTGVVNIRKHTSYVVELESAE